MFHRNEPSSPVGHETGDQTVYIITRAATQCREQPRLADGGTIQDQRRPYRADEGLKRNEGSHIRPPMQVIVL
jgi:hypothetical protein